MMKTENTDSVHCQSNSGGGKRMTNRQRATPVIPFIHVGQTNFFRQTHFRFAEPIRIQRFNVGQNLTLKNNSQPMCYSERRKISENTNHYIIMLEVMFDFINFQQIPGKYPGTPFNCPFLTNSNNLLSLPTTLISSISSTSSSSEPLSLPPYTWSRSSRHGQFKVKSRTLLLPIPFYPFFSPSAHSPSFSLPTIFQHHQPTIRQ